MPHKFTPTIQKFVRKRARYLCEYCHASEKWQYVAFTIEHIIPITRGGSHHSENLALCCFSCNRKKSDKVTGVDPQTQQTVDLFHPRKHPWHEHFIWSADKLQIVGVSAVGRVTIVELDLNRERLQTIRKADLDLQRHPPPNDLSE